MNNNEADSPFRLLGVNEKFKFHCTQCGECCKNRHDILLSPFDIYRIAKVLKMEPIDVIEKYCEVYIGEESKMPNVAIYMKEGENCPLLNADNKCSVQESKPIICAMFPLGRVVKADMETGEMNIGYILQNVDCGGTDEEHSIQEWIESFGIDFYKSNIEFATWSKIRIKISEAMQEFAKFLPENYFMSIIDRVATCLYIIYDTEAPIMPQLNENIKVIDNFISDIRKILSGVKTQNDDEE